MQKNKYSHFFIITPAVGGKIYTVHAFFRKHLTLIHDFSLQQYIHQLTKTTGPSAKLANE